ncbi:MAG: CHAP domain-containing protein [Actinomycetales bacterium]|nr:CHAP domain-containing protein [Actinomycetales bacterium]
MTFARQTLRQALLAAVVLLLAVVPVPASAKDRSTASVSVSHSSLRKGELVWFKGRVTSKGKAVAGAKVYLDRQSRAGSAWRRAATLKTRKNGTFTYRQRVTKTTTYRARVASTKALRADVSPSRTVRVVKSDRTLADRAASIGKRLGKAKGKVRTVSSRSSTKVRYRNYSKMMLVEVAKPSSTRTWLVTGDIRTAYLRAGGPSGKLGRPLTDPKCGLLESGCVQRFAGGAIYDNKNTKGAVVYGKGRKTEVLAAARSQVGYAQKTFNHSKYNSWISSEGQPWCSAFMSWLSAASGNGDLIPKHKRLRHLVADLKENHASRFGSKPKVGALAFYDLTNDGVTKPTHIGIVLKVNSSRIVTIEGNTSNPATGNGRGVYEKNRAASFPLYYWYPEY